jgi:hypothetical protein
MEEKVFKPKYNLFHWFSLIVLFFIMFGLFFVIINADMILKDKMFFIAFEILLLIISVSLFISLSYKKIIFSDNIRVERRILKNYNIEYDEVNKVGLKVIETERGKIVHMTMKNSHELLKIVKEKIDQGLIQFTEKNSKSMAKEMKISRLISISVPVSIVLYLLLPFIPLVFCILRT